MKKSQLISILADKYPYLKKNQIAETVELILSTIDKRVIFDLKEFYLQCDLKWDRGRYLNEIPVFRSNCSVDEKHDRCARHTPTNVLFITDIVTEAKEMLIR